MSSSPHLLTLLVTCYTAPLSWWCPWSPGRRCCHCVPGVAGVGGHHPAGQPRLHIRHHQYSSASIYIWTWTYDQHNTEQVCLEDERWRKTIYNQVENNRQGCSIQTCIKTLQFMPEGKILDNFPSWYGLFKWPFRDLEALHAQTFNLFEEGIAHAAVVSCSAAVWMIIVVRRRRGMNVFVLILFYFMYLFYIM